MRDIESERAALAAIFCTHRTEFRRVAQRFVVSGALAEDIVQDAFLAVWHRRPWPARSRLTAYTFATVRKLAMNQARREAVERRWLQRASSDVTFVSCAGDEDENLERL